MTDQCRVLASKQGGVALLIVLSAIFSAGSFALILLSTQGQTGRVSGSSLISLADQIMLTNARQSLLSYTALYPWLYGPRGAGPGHLPCPDTDDLHGHTGSHWAAGDGPNPPCGNLSVAAGKLPRHVRLTHQRYAFHTEATQIAEYRVSDQVVNNPVNRIVNPSLLNDSSNLGPIAMIELPTVARTLSVRSAQGVSLSRDALLDATLPSVAAWIVEQSQSLPQSWCQAISTDQENQEHSSVPVDRTNALQCARYLKLVQHCPEYQAMFLVLDKLPAADICTVNQASELSIDGVPATTHWFVRNQWPAWIDISIDEHCIEGLANNEPCLLVLSRSERHTGTLVVDESQAANRAIKMLWTPGYAK